jgi:hypothetical protein
MCCQLFSFSILIFKKDYFENKLNYEMDVFYYKRRFWVVTLFWSAYFSDLPTKTFISLNRITR